MRRVLSIISCLLMIGIGAAAEPTGKWTDEGNYASEYESIANINGKYVIHIRTAAQLAKFSKEYGVEFSNKSNLTTVYIDDDINLSAHYWNPTNIIPMTSVYIDGNGHKISGMTLRDCENSGLFGESFDLTIKNLTISNAHIETVDQFSGFLASQLNGGTIRNCTVENSTLVIGNSASSMTYVGGLVGYYQPTGAGTLSGNSVVKTVITSHASQSFLGGQVGLVQILSNEGKLTMTDCHTNVEIVCDGSSASASIGGLVGLSETRGELQVLFCSSSGTLASEGGTDSNSGGLVGLCDGQLVVENSVSSMSMEGSCQGSQGGLVGNIKYSSEVDIKNSFCSSYIYSSSASASLGGLVGKLDTDQCNLTNCTYAGTVYGSSSKAGNIIGSIGSTAIVGQLKTDHRFNEMVYDRFLCQLPAIGNADGFEDDAITSKTTKEMVSDDEPYNSLLMAPIDIREEYQKKNGKALCYEDNVMLAAIPFFVKDPQHSYYCAWQVTTAIELKPLAYNRATKTALATYDVVKAPEGAAVNTFLSVQEDAESAEKTVTPLDPGEADVVVTYYNQATRNRVQRKVHLAVTYGVPWNDDEPTDFPGGNGAINDPYLIQNASQLRAVAQSEVYNREDMYFRLANDIFMNTHLIQHDETAKEGAKAWEPIVWKANLDGNGKSIYGLYVDDCKVERITKSGTGTMYNGVSEIITYYTEYRVAGLFGVLSGHVHDLAIVDSYLSVYTIGGTTFCGLLCGLMTGDAKIERCMAHGIVDSNHNGCGMVGHASDIDVEQSKQYSRKEYSPITVDCGTIEDCFSCVHVEFELKYSRTGIQRDQADGAGYGIAGPGVKKTTRCVSIGKVEHFKFRGGVSAVTSGNDLSTWYFDKQQMTTEKQSAAQSFERTTTEMIQGDIFTDQPAWQHEKGRYPMLRQFANTPYGDILSMPVHFADGDRAGHVTQIFEFPIENVTWSAANGQTYVDMINECGAATPMSTTPNLTSEFIYAQTNTAESQCTKALRVMALNTVVNGIVGIQFEDPKCEAAWLSAFDKGENEVVTLRNAYTVTEDQAKAFNNAAQSLGVTAFPEMRFFTGIKVLKEGMLSNLSQLSELQLPRQLTDIGPEAFSGCSSLAEVTLPVTTTAVEPGVLDGSSIKDIYVEPRNTHFEVRDHALLTTDLDLRLMAYPPARGEKSITLHGPFHNIAWHAFNRIPGLDEIYIDYPKPEGSVVQLEDDEAIVHYNYDTNHQLMDIYVNDGTFDGNQWGSTQYATGGNLDGILMKEYTSKSYWQSYANAGKLHRYFPLTITSAKWATMYIGFCTQLPDNMKAYVLPASPKTGQSTLTLKRISNKLHHTVPVAIYCEEPGTYILNPEPGMSIDDDIPMTANKLQGTDIGQNGNYGYATNQTDIQNEFSILTLSIGNNSGTVGFYGFIGIMIPPYKAYLPYNQVGVRAFDLMIDDEMLDVTTIGTTLKYDGQQAGELRIYDLSGRRIISTGNKTGTALPSTLKDGIYIVNGRKVVVRKH